MAAATGSNQRRDVCSALPGNVASTISCVTSPKNSAMPISLTGKARRWAIVK